ncbi:MAG TPA: efflux RND transporter periplasmic adaptor subunit [Steroidobacteraceae bacterium]|nr:efflux RND transporter periplasmic adaptor subunit [Steroidobacteraceae bacterium]
MAGSPDLRVGAQSPTTPLIGTRSWRTGRLKWVVVALGLLLALAGYRYVANKTATSAAARLPKAPVRVATVERRNMAVVEHTLGTVIADSTVQISARVEGMLQTAYFHEGQFVKKGDLLFQIDPRPYQAALAQAQATLQHDQALLRNAERDKLRYEKLFGQNSASSQQVDTAAANADALAATIALDKAAVNVAQLNLGYTQIRSPIDGKTGALLVQPGNMISGTPSAALVTINELQPIKLSFDLPQSDYWRIRSRGQSDPLLATIDLPRARGGPLSAPVNFTSNAVDNQSGTIELRATFANTSLSLLPGQTVNVRVKMSDIPDATVVPHDAINYGPNGPFVYVVVNGRAVMRPVTVRFDDAKDAAISGDLKPGDAVILEGQLRVEAGERVNVLPPADVHLSPSDMNLGPEYGPLGPSG